MDVPHVSLLNSIVFSERNTPILCPPDLETSEAEIYKELQDTINNYHLPVTHENCQVRKQIHAETHTELLIGLEDPEFKYLKVLVGIEKIGALSYVERKFLFISPPLKSPLFSTSSELPPRLTTESPELPQRLRYPASTAKGVTFKGVNHKQRVMLIEERRQERYSMIIQRDAERNEIIDAWLEEFDEILSFRRKNPLFKYLPDAVDLMIQILAQNYKERGAKIKDLDEIERKEEDLKQALKEVRDNF